MPDPVAIAQPQAGQLLPITLAFAGAQPILGAAPLLIGMEPAAPPLWAAGVLVGSWVLGALAVVAVRKAQLGDVALVLTAPADGPQRHRELLGSPPEGLPSRLFTTHIQGLIAAELVTMAALGLAVVLQVPWLALPSAAVSLVLVLLQLPTPAVRVAALQGLLRKERAGGGAGPGAG